MMRKVNKFTASIAALGLAMVLSACAHVEGPATEEATPSQDALVEGLAAITIPVSDIEAAEAFYVASLDATFVRRMDVEAYREAIYALPDADGAKLVLIQSLTGKSTLGPVRMVFSTSQAEAAVRASVAAGATVERAAGPIPGMDIVIGIVHDADGNTLEFIQR